MTDRAVSMRFDAFDIRNYKGIARAQLDDIADQAIVTISGRNGTGKSLLLEALVGGWAARYNMPERVGPWGDELSISMSVHLTDDEWQVLDRWHTRYHGVAVPRDQGMTYEIVAGPVRGQQVVNDSPALQTLRNAQFQREHPFSKVDFLPANRLVPMTPSGTVDLGMLNMDRIEQERLQVMDQIIQQRSPMSLPSIASYLVTLDYQALLASRQGLDTSNEYERLAAAFLGSTGKTLLEPRLRTEIP